MKPFKTFFLILLLSLLTFFLFGCPNDVQDDSSSQNQEKVQQLQNIYFDYPVRGEPIGKTEDSQLYWDCCSDNDFCDSYNGAFHSGEDWNLKGGSSGEIDEGKPVYSIGEGKVIYAKEEDVGFRVVIEHTGNCIIPAKENIGGSNISYDEETVDKIYSVYLHLKDLQVKVGDEVGINDVIGKIKKYDPEVSPHLHFEIRKEWNNVFYSYFVNIQKIIELGFRDPSDFIEANNIRNKVIISSPQTVEEESFSIKTNADEEEKEVNNIDIYNKKLTEYLVYKSELEKLLKQYELKYGNSLGSDINLDDLDESNYKEVIESFKLISSFYDSWIDDYKTIKIPDFAKDGSKYYLDWLNNDKLIADQWIIVIEHMYIDPSKINFDELIEMTMRIDELCENSIVLENNAREEFNNVELGLNEEAEILGLTQLFPEE